MDRKRRDHRKETSNERKEKKRKANKGTRQRRQTTSTTFPSRLSLVCHFLAAPREQLLTSPEKFLQYCGSLAATIPRLRRSSRAQRQEWTHIKE